MRNGKRLVAFLTFGLMIAAGSYAVAIHPTNAKIHRR